MSQKKPDSAGCMDKLAPFYSVVIILGVSLTPPSGPPVVEIMKAPENFHIVFGYPHGCLPMLLDDLFSAANEGKDVSDLRQAIESGLRHNAFIILRDAQGMDLACDIEASMGNKMKDGYVSQSSVDPNGLHRDFLTTMTIQLTSKNGNARALGALADPYLVDSNHLDFDPERRAQFLDQVDRTIDENIQRNKDQKQQKSVKNTTTNPSAATTTLAKPRAAPAPAPAARNNTSVSTSASSSSVSSAPSMAHQRSHVRANAPAALPSLPRASPIVSIEASMAAGYYVPPVMAVAQDGFVDSRRSADLPVEETEAYEEDDLNGHNEHGSNVNEGEWVNNNGGEDVEGEDDNSGTENEGTNTVTEEVPVIYQNIW